MILATEAEQIRELRAEIWEQSGKDLQRIAKVRQSLGEPLNTVYYWQRVLINLQQPRRPSRKAKYQLREEHRERYCAAYHKYQEQYVEWTKGGHTLDPLYPDTSTSNGLTQFALKYLTWMGHRATRITTEGRSIIKNGETMRIPTLTRKGTADISATINGRSVMLEIKCGADKPSAAQLKEQARERAAGGIYEFVKNVEQLFAVYDKIVS